jgi:hypothetical protein
MFVSYSAPLIIANAMILSTKRRFVHLDVGPRELFLFSRPRLSTSPPPPNPFELHLLGTLREFTVLEIGQVKSPVPSDRVAALRKSLRRPAKVSAIAVLRAGSIFFLQVQQGSGRRVANTDR